MIATMIGYYLAPHSYYSDFPDGVIFLNLRGCRYLGLPHDTAAALLRAATSRESADQDPQPIEGLPVELCETLIRYGVFIPFPQKPRSTMTCPIPARSALVLTRHDDLPVPARSVCNLAHAYLCARMALWRRRLDTIVDCIYAPTKSPDKPVVEEESIRRLMSHFLQLRPYLYTARQACLRDSLTLCTYLHFSGVASTLVLGAKTKPFLAHAWVQFDDTVLNDSVERVMEFTPLKPFSQRVLP